MARMSETRKVIFISVCICFGPFKLQTLIILISKYVLVSIASPDEISTTTRSKQIFPNFCPYRQLHMMQQQLLLQ